jgi:hypothetical protein
MTTTLYLAIGIIAVAAFFVALVVGGNRKQEEWDQ